MQFECHKHCPHSHNDKVPCSHSATNDAHTAILTKCHAVTISILQSAAHLHRIQPQVVGVEAQEDLAACPSAKELDNQVLVHKHAAPHLLNPERGGLPVVVKGANKTPGGLGMRLGSQLVFVLRIHCDHEKRPGKQQAPEGCKPAPGGPSMSRVGQSHIMQYTCH
eukprot:1077012-Pelagomonas_calceolata.AAC.3